MPVSTYPVTLNEVNCSCFLHIINILLTELSRSVWENLDLGRVYRPHCVRSVLTTSVKILPYRPPARLIRAKSYICREHSDLTFFIEALETKVSREHSRKVKKKKFLGQFFFLMEPPEEMFLYLLLIV